MQFGVHMPGIAEEPSLRDSSAENFGLCSRQRNSRQKMTDDPLRYLEPSLVAVERGDAVSIRRTDKRLGMEEFSK